MHSVNAFCLPYGYCLVDIELPDAFKSAVLIWLNLLDDWCVCMIALLAVDELSELFCLLIGDSEAITICIVICFSVLYHALFT